MKMRIRSTLKNSARGRLILRSTAGLMLGAALGICIFFYGNIGNTTKTAASITTDRPLTPRKDTQAPKAPGFIMIQPRGSSIGFSWINQADRKDNTAEGILILRRKGLTEVIQPVEMLETASALDLQEIEGWQIIYNGKTINTYQDKEPANGSYTYLIYSRNKSGKFTDPLAASRLFIINGKDIRETFNASTTLSALWVAPGCSITTDTGSSIRFTEHSAITIYGNFELGGTLVNDGAACTFGSGASFIYNIKDERKAAIPVANWQKGSRCIIKRTGRKAPEGLDQTFANFTWDCNQQNTDIYLPGNLTVNETVDIKQTGTGGHTLYISGINTFNGDVLISERANIMVRNRSQIFLSGTTAQSIKGNISFEHVVFDNTEGFDLYGNFSIRKTVSLKNGAVNLPKQTVFSINNHATIKRSKGSLHGQPLFTGGYDLHYQAPLTTGDEVAPDEQALRNLTVDLEGEILLEHDLNINNTLALKRGKIITGEHVVKIKNNWAGSIKEHSAAGYVAGRLVRAVNGKSTYDFPVGTKAYYELATVDLVRTEGVREIEAQFIASKPDKKDLPDDVRLNGTAINDFLDNGYWKIIPDQELTGGHYQLTLHQTGQKNKATNERCYGVVKKDHNNYKWHFEGKHSMKLQREDHGVVTAARQKLKELGDFAIAYTPISLLLYQSSFTAMLRQQAFTDLVWKTSIENNYVSLIAERSTDSIHFEAIGALTEQTEKGSTLEFTFQDKTPLSGVSYYRIKQTEANGKISYSQVCSIVNQMNVNVSADTER